MNAPWQVYFYIVPLVKSYEKDISLKWEGNDIIYSLEAHFRDILWKKDSISENIAQYGNINETCIEVFCENSTYEIMVSLDLRGITEDFIENLCDFCNYNDAQILTGNGQLLKATQKNIINIIATSEGAKFCMYIEPYFAKRRDEIQFNRKYFWEYYVPENMKFHTFEEIKNYVKEYQKKQD